MVSNLAKPLKVIHTLGFPIDFNGNITRVLGEASHVARFGVDVKIIVSDKVPVNLFRQAIRSGVKIYNCNVLIPWKEVGWRINNTFPLLLTISKVVKNDPNCILHVAAPSPVTKPLTASVIGRRLKMPVVLDLHDPWSSDPFSLNPILLLQTQIMRHVINNVDFIVVPYKALLKLVRSVNRDKPATIIPNAVDSNLFRPVARNTYLAQKLGLNEDNLVVAFNGHVTRDKGLITLARSAQIVVQKHKNVRFLVIGNGPFMREVTSFTEMAGLSNAFRFVSFVPQELVIEYLSLADICVAPYEPMAFFKVSLPETPLKVVEYMAMGKPVIMSKISDDNIITWSGGGLLVTPGDASELASNIINLIEDEKWRKNFGEKGRKYVEKNLSWERHAERLVKIYQSLSTCN
jgi:glycosyltransferase involved in cell wall biosynthesis